MPVEKIDTLIVGGGQSGIAMSEHLGDLGIPHLVLERDRVAESWMSRRWDSLVANGPAWHDRFPNLTFDEVEPDAFPHKERVAKYLQDYARKIEAPIRTGVEVKHVRHNENRAGYVVTTSAGVFEANRVVAATGPFQIPTRPTLVPTDAGVDQIHSSDYKNPGQLAEGAVLVVGCGASGSQIAGELCGAGRKVYLSVGEHYRPPRAYRQRDYCWWLGVLGLWDEVRIKPKKKHVAFAVSGYGGGETVDFRRLAGDGITLVGMTDSYDRGAIRFRDDLAHNIAVGDESYFEILREADLYVGRKGMNLPAEPEAWERLPDPDCLLRPLTSLNLAEAGITTIVWATGFRYDFSWLDVDAFDEDGAPLHKRGVSAENGIYFIGLPNLSNRASSFIYGCWHDAKHIAGHIASQRSYDAYERVSRAPDASPDLSLAPRTV